MSFPIYRTIAKVAFAPKLTITVCGTLQAQVVFESNGEFLCVKTSEETMMEQVLKTKVNKIYPFEGLYDKKKEIVGTAGEANIVCNIKLSKINGVSAKSNKSLLLFLYKHAIENYDNNDLVIARASLDTVKKQFENLFSLLSPLDTLKYIEPRMPENIKKEYQKLTKKNLEDLDKFSTFYFSLDQEEESLVVPV